MSGEMEDSSPVMFLSALIEAKESDSTGHCTRVATLAAELAVAIGLEPGQVESIRTTAQVHDLGKIRIPDEILCKPSRLTVLEFALIQRHPDVGQRLLCAFPELEFARAGVHAHHERWDGHGYPARLAGEDIPLASRIIAIADSFDAMCTDRPYSEARAPRDAVHEIVRCAGTQFDPNLAIAFADSFCTGDRSITIQEKTASSVDSRFVGGTLTSVVATDSQGGFRERNGARRWHMLEKSAPLVSLVARSLSSSERLVLELHYLDRLPCPEIAEILETTENHITQILADVSRRITGVRRSFVDVLCESA
ncbi:MAG: HD domain-containing protein [Phycisphaerales bacterium]|nr:HD domain-containing protein [Phycisphaerales bacterium]